MSRRIHVPAQWESHREDFINGWKDAEEGYLHAGPRRPAPSRLLSYGKYPYPLWAYEAGFTTYKAKHPPKKKEARRMSTAAVRARYRIDRADYEGNPVEFIRWCSQLEAAQAYVDIALRTAQVRGWLVLITDLDAQPGQRAQWLYGPVGVSQ